MATLTFTFTVGSEARASMSRIAQAIEQACAHMPDRNSTGASTVVTLDNGPSTGVCSVRVTAGPYSLMPDGSNSPTIIA